MKRFRLAGPGTLLGAILFACAAAAADDPPAAVTNAAAARAAGTNAASALPADGTALPERPERNPFWPVGRDPTAVAALAAAATPGGPEPPPKPPVPAADWDGARKLVHIEGLSRSSSGKSVAIINGKVWQSGDSLSVDYNGRVYRWIIRSIGDKGVDLSRTESPPEPAP